MFFSPPPSPPPQPIVTVWIHGSNPQEFLPRTVSHFTQKMTSIFFGEKKGLHKITDLDMQSYSFFIARALAQTAPDLFPLEHFYSFGWTGKLDPEERKIAAYDLFCELKLLSDNYLKIFGVLPKFVLISHSHGGNVILHMAQIEDPTCDLIIDKAILLACPVQKYTAHLIHNKMFKRVYSLHSHTDIFQIADPQGLHTMFARSEKNSTTECEHNGKKSLLSQRHFDAHPKLAQACIKWKNCPIWHKDDCILNDNLLHFLTQAIKKMDHLKKNRGLFHVEFKLLPFMRQLPYIIEQLDKHIDNSTNCTSDRPDILVEL